MGCSSYRADTWDTPTQTGGECWVHFSEDDESYGCLCTFPNSFDRGELQKYRVRDLAMLGAAIVLAQQEPITKEYFAIPRDVPEWIRKGIDAALGINDEAQDATRGTE